jgi:hypothetical protein
MAVATQVRGVATATNTDPQQLQELVRQSQLAEQTLCLPAIQYRDQPQVVPAAELERVRQHVADVEGSLYTGAQLAAQLEVLQRNCVASMSGGESIEVAGGLDSFSCSSITVSGDTATATCQEVKWIQGLVKTPQGIQPNRAVGPDTVVDEFVRTPDGWRISGEKIIVPPGTGP